MADMKTPAGFRAYLAQLEALPFVTSTRVRAAPATSADASHDAALTLKTKAGTHHVLATEYKSHLTNGAASRIIASSHDVDVPLLILAPHVGASLGKALSEAGINYLDRQGNCHLELNDKVFVHVEGRRSARHDIMERGIRAAGYGALFAYLAEPRLLDATVRAAAEVAGVSRQAIHDMRRRLLQEGSIVRAAKATRWLPRRREDSLQRWLNGYQTTVRPSIACGTYRVPDKTPAALESHIERFFAGEIERGWCWGGSAAGFRLTGHYRGERTVVHVEHDPKALVAELRGLPDPHGQLVLLSSFGNLDWKDGDETANPLLVYSEMLAANDERATEAANELFRDLILPTWENPA